MWSDATGSTVCSTNTDELHERVSAPYAPSRSTSMIPAASASNSCLAAMTASCRVAARSWSGCRSVRVPMLLARWRGRSAWACAFGSGRRTGEPGQQARHNDGLGCRSGPTAPRSRVGAPLVPPTDIMEPTPPPYYPAGRRGICGFARWLPGWLGVAAPAANRSRQAGTRLPSAGGPRSRLPASAGRSSHHRHPHPSPPVRVPPAARAWGPRRGAAVERCASGKTRPGPRSHTGPGPGRTAA